MAVTHFAVADRTNDSGTLGLAGAVLNGIVEAMDRANHAMCDGMHQSTTQRGMKVNLVLVNALSSLPSPITCSYPFHFLTSKKRKQLMKMSGTLPSAFPPPNHRATLGLQQVPGVCDDVLCLLDDAFTTAWSKTPSSTPEPNPLAKPPSPTPKRQPQLQLQPQQCSQPQRCLVCNLQAWRSRSHLCQTHCCIASFRRMLRRSDSLRALAQLFPERCLVCQRHRTESADRQDAERVPLVRLGAHLLKLRRLCLNRGGRKRSTSVHTDSASGISQHVGGLLLFAATLLVPEHTVELTLGNEAYANTFPPDTNASSSTKRSFVCDDIRWPRNNPANCVV